MTANLTITGWGTALPDKTVTNADLEGWLDTTDEWIVERSGISERRIGTSTSALAIDAGRAALAQAGCAPDDIGLLIVATVTPDQTTPAVANVVQEALGLGCGAFDLNAACSGFVYGLVTAHGFLATGVERILLIGAETLSRITDWDDRNTAVLFGDGAGAVVLEATDGPDAVLGWDLGSDGSAAGILRADIGGFVQMDGREVFRRAVRVMVDSAQRSLKEAGLGAADVDLVVPHQANRRIIEAACQRLDIPMDRAALVLQHTGNTSSASIPLALVDALEHDRISRGDIVLLVGFGAGMTWGSAVLRWP